MSRPPRRKRPNRVRRWQGLVEDVSGDLFCARLVAVHHGCIELWADFPRKHLPGAERGMVFNLYVHRRGRKTRTVMREKDLGVWTEAEVAGIRARAAETFARLGGLLEEA